MDSCITQLKAQRPSRTCDESKEEEEEDLPARRVFREGFEGWRAQELRPVPAEHCRGRPGLRHLRLGLRVEGSGYEE